jgi:hypothetical protein
MAQSHFITGLHTAGGVDINVTECRRLSLIEIVEQETQMARARFIKARRTLVAGPRVSPKLTLVSDRTG